MKKLMFLAMSAVCLASCTFVKASDNDSESFLRNTKVRGSGKITTEKYTVADFDKVSVSISADVKYVVTDGEPYVIVTADDNAQEYLKFESSGKNLRIKPNRDNVNFVNCDIDIVVASSNLREISIAGSSDFEVASPLKTDDFKCSIAGSGDVDIDGLEASSISFEIAGSGDIDASGINCKELDCSIAGSGDIELGGYAELARYSIAGSGDIDATDFKSDHSKTSIAGSGTIKN